MGVRIAKWIAIVVAALFALVGLLLVAIDTAPGRAFVVRQLNAYETASGMVFHVDRIDGSLYGRMTLIGFEVRDPRGAFLVASRAALDWRPFAYARGRIDVRSLIAPDVTLRRMPVLKPTPTDPNAPLLPDIDLAIGSLRVDRLTIEPPVTGKRHIMRLAGAADIADGRARITADADALRAAGIAGGDRLRLRLDAVPQANRLFLDVKLDAPVGGLVDSYAGLGKPLRLSIGGSGDWASWAGRARGTLAGAALADLAITARRGSFTVKGRSFPGRALAGPAARLVEPALDVDVAGTLAERRVDMRLIARSAAAEVRASGLIDLAASRFGTFRIAGALLRPGAIAENLRGRDVAFDATLDGPFATPTVQYRVSAAAIAFGTTGVEGLTASGRATVDSDRILIPVAATARRVTGLNAAAGGLLESVTLAGDLAYSNGRLLSDNLRIRSSRIDATAIVVADIANGKYTGALKGRVNDYQVDGLGRINLQTDAELITGPGGGFGVRGWVRANTRRLDNASVRDFLGGNADVYADFLFDENGVASVRNLRVAAPAFTLRGGSGRYATADGRIDFRANATSRVYGPLAVTATGTLERPVVRLRAARPYVGIQLNDVNAELVGTAAGYQVRATGGSPYGPFAADLLVRTGRGPLTVDIRSARFAGVDLRGSIAQTRAGPFAGTVTLAGSGIVGSVRLAAAGANQRADFDIVASAARIPGTLPITIGSGTVRGSATLLPAGPSLIADANLRDVRSGGTLVSRLRAKIDYAGGRGRVQLAAAGRSGVPFDITAQAALSPTQVVANARGTANGIAFRLAQPAVARRERGDWVLSAATIVVPQGQVRLAGRYGAAGVSGQATLDNLDVSIVQAFAPGLGLGGKASGTIAFAPGRGGVPTADARLTIADFTRTAAYVVSQPVDVAMLGRLSDAGADVRAVVRRGGAAVGRLQARLAPLGAGATLTQRLFAAPLGGGIRYNGPAEVLWTLTGISGQTLSGPVAVAADFGGRADQPTLTGVVRSTALRYENQAYGTVISNIAIDGRFTRSRFELTSLTGSAGRGSVAARGSVGLDAASGFPIDLTATLDGAQLALSDALSAAVSGTIAVTNSRAGGALIRGDLRIPQARYEIIRQGAAEVAELTGVRRKNAPPPGTQGTSETVPSNWKLDIRVRADNKIYVSGMGLEAEWATDLRVRGTATAPVVVGKLEIVRGTYSFAGRRFDLAETGEITFDGGALTNPQLNLAATTTVEGVTATIDIGGRALAPQISFTSTPSLPQDEVLSRLLFGSSVTSLSPTQAIQLAAALNSLRGSGGGGLNPLGKLRSATGIDRLRILGADKTAGRGTALAAGQYISNDIYVEVITDARGFTATQLEIALSKSLSVLSSVSSFGGQSVNLRYSKDY